MHSIRIYWNHIATGVVELLSNKLEGKPRASVYSHLLIRHPMNRSIYLILICLGCILSTSLFAQRGGLTRNPTEIGVDYTYFSDPGDQQVLATLAFKRSAGFIPRFSPFITSEFLSIAGVIRSYSDQDSTDLRWRGTLYNGEFSRNLLVFGLTLASFDESGLMQEDYRWAAIRLGIG